MKKRAGKDDDAEWEADEEDHRANRVARVDKQSWVKDAITKAKKKRPAKKIKEIIRTEPVTLATYHASDKFVAPSVADARETVKAFGAAIVRGVVSAEDCDHAMSGLWDFAENRTGGKLKRDDVTTYHEYLALFPSHSMLLQHYGIGHAQFAWDLRQNESVVNVFATMWGVPPEELLVSFDGSSLHLPPEHVGRGRGWYKDRTWLHTDQNLSRNGEECIQGFVALRDVHPGDATFTFLEGSHRWHKAFAETFGVVSKGDWYQLANQDEYNFFTVTQGCILRSLTCRKGDMVLWDSRTMHAGQQPLASRPEPNVRGVCYICMLPRSTLQYPVGDIAAKQKAFKNKSTTSHWPNRAKAFGKTPQTYGSELPKAIHEPLPDPVLTPLGKKLAGF